MGRRLNNQYSLSTSMRLLVSLLLVCSLAYVSGAPKPSSIVSNLGSNLGAALDGYCSETLRTCAPMGYCCKGGDKGCKIPRCKWYGWTWALIIGGPLLAILIIAGLVVYCKKKNSGGA